MIAGTEEQLWGEVKVELELENAVDRELLRLGHIA